jgi:type I restriction enzyme S subunit
MERQNNIPSLRFPEYDGEWFKTKLGDLSSLITKGTTPKKFVPEGIKFIKIECFDGDTINSNKCLFIDEVTHNKELKRSILKEGDILFAIAGATIGKVNVVSEDILPANTNQALSIVRLKNDVSRDFVYHNLKSNNMQRYILDNISVGAQPNLNLEQMNNFSFYTSSINEQTKIASFLTKVDEKLTAFKKKKELLEQYKKGVMQQIFSQELRFKDDDGNDYPDWEEKTLGEIMSIADRVKPKTIDKNKLLTVKLHLKGLFKNESTDGLSIGSTNYFIRKEGQFIYGKQNLFNGAFGIIPKEFDGFLSSGDVPSLDIDFSKISSHFLFCFLGRKTFYKRLEDIASGSGSKRIHENTLLKVEISVPNFKEQTKIADFLSTIDNKISYCQSQIEKAEVWKKGLLQQMFC